MGKKHKQITAEKCPCGSGEIIDNCCGQYLHNSILAPTAEKLMRSRYSAYVLQNENYLLDTWHHSTRPPVLSINPDTNTKWLGLKIIESGHDAVEFIATYKLQGKAYRLHELSRFVFEHGQWFYIDGLQHDTPGK